MTDEKTHLPVIGAGPLYVVPITAFTAAGILLVRLGIIPSLGENYTLPFRIAGVPVTALGIYLWVSAVIISRIDVKIKENTLVTDGIYAHVRNPIYSAFLFICTGVLLLCANCYLLVLPPVFLLYLTVFIKLTEEKWLSEHYGKAFKDYCKRVNRCIPSIRAR